MRGVGGETPFVVQRHPQARQQAIQGSQQRQRFARRTMFGQGFQVVRRAFADVGCKLVQRPHAAAHRSIDQQAQPGQRQHDRYGKLLGDFQGDAFAVTRGVGDLHQETPVG